MTLAKSIQLAALFLTMVLHNNSQAQQTQIGEVSAADMSAP
jgi:hypothetical protein